MGCSGHGVCVVSSLGCTVEDSMCIAACRYVGLQAPQPVEVHCGGEGGQAEGKHEGCMGLAYEGIEGRVA